MIYSNEWLSSRNMFVSLICGIVLSVSGCASMLMPDGVTKLPSGPDGLQRFEVTKVSKNEPPITSSYKNDTWQIEMGLPEGWKLDGELTKQGKSPLKAEFTRPNAWLTVYCWDGASDVAVIRKKTIDAIQGIDAPVESGQNVWVVPGAGQAAEMVTVFGYHDAVITVPDITDPKTGKPVPVLDPKTGKRVAYNQHFNKTFKIIAKPATHAGGCNYGIRLLEVTTEDKTFADTLAGHALAIARGLK